MGSHPNTNSYKKVDRGYSCDHCSKIFKTRAMVIRHIDTQHENCPKIQCTMCDVSYHRYYIKIHFDMVHLNKYKYVKLAEEEDTNEIDDIFNEFEDNDKTNVSKHEKKSKKKIKIESEEDYTNALDNFKILEKSVDESIASNPITSSYKKADGGYSCDHCNKVFKTRAMVIRHIDTQHENCPKIQCTMCLASYHRYYIKTH